MLPQIMPERRLRTFKFWFNRGLQDGLYYQNELYYRSKSVEAGQRSRLYQLACKLGEHNANILLTTTEAQYSLWINLRNQKLAALTLSYSILPTADALIEGLASDSSPHAPH